MQYIAHNSSSSADGDDEIIFEAFETSATCDKVLASENALLWDFPGQAAALPTKIFMEDSFQDGLATFLQQASLESICQFAAVTLKAAAPLPEIRDSPHPTLVSEVLMTLLKAIGRAHTSTLLRKRVRDTVSFNNAPRPWRRSPFYLVLRVSMQRKLYKDLGPEVGRLYFKTTLCLFLSHFVDDSHRFLTHEMSHYLRTKLGRRLAKLEVDRDRVHGAKSQHEHLFRSLRPIFDTSLSTVDLYLKDQWSQQKTQLRRPISPLPGRAGPADLQLTLPLSRLYLEKMLQDKLMQKPAHQQTAAELLGTWESSNSATRPITKDLARQIALANFEESEVLSAKSLGNHLSTYQACANISETITTYIDKVGETYNEFPLQKSQMLLHIMELWISLDKLTVSKYELLENFHPHFEPTMLDDLQLLGYEDMARLRRVQSYIEGRCQQACAESQTIFSPPNKNCFAARYFDMSFKHMSFRAQIEDDAKSARAQKEHEWEVASKRNEELSKQIAELSCAYEVTINKFGETVREHKRGCHKHRLKWQAKQIKIGVHEHPLPRFDPAAKAVVFELDCPGIFRIYRDATWLILKTFAYAAQKRLTGVSTLGEYSSLIRYSKRPSERIITLGSSTKSHLKTHYAEFGFPVSLEDVCRPCGLKWDYFDSAAATWISRTDQTSFAQLFPLRLPPGSAYGSLNLPCNAWPTSNEILASQTKCPAELNVHEFMAWQSLLVGTHCRWLSLLRELGATNLNFSTDATWAIVCRLIYQVGPASTNCNSGEVHGVLDDKHFCYKILEQVRQRVESIRRNWREFTQMDIMLSILEKIISFSPDGKIQRMTLGLFETARQITWEWQKALVSSHTTDSSGTPMFLIWASLLCKRAFYQSPWNTQQGGLARIQSYLRSSITLQNNLIGTFDAMPLSLRHALLCDISSTYAIRSHISDAINSDCQGTLLNVLGDIWALPREPYVELNYNEQTGWFGILLVSDNYTTSHIHYNVLFGVLLINGQQLGTLPPEYRRPVTKRLFGHIPLHVFPSPRPGMSLVISELMPFGHRVHLGFREGEVIVRAEHGQGVLEYVPVELFSRGVLYDLPNALVEDCYHWMDLTRHIMEIRQGDCWKCKKSNWFLNMHTRRATRRSSILVDPCSQLYKLTMYNFLYFEEPRHITLYQPEKLNLSVELKRLELSFSVDPRGLLRSKQLGAVIERDQDAGTWYGLYSSIVIRSVANSSQRSILVPMGRFVFERHLQHVRIRIVNSGNYLRFDINETLGRIECPAEPRLLYTKALCHAYTSHFLPDPLTQRTGLDEALYNLGTALYQPWTTVAAHVAGILTELSELTPCREYYPTGLRCMESVRWNQHLTSHIQDDRYRGVIDTMFQTLADLAMFGSESLKDHSTLCAQGELHLEKRAQSRIYVTRTGKDNIYNARDTGTDSEGRRNIASVSRALAAWCPVNIPSIHHLPRLFQKYPIVSGYGRDFDKVQLSDLLALDLGVEWGALSHTCLKSGQEDKFRLMFLLAPIAFSLGVESDLVSLLVDYSVSPKLKKLKTPEAASFVRFIADDVPDVERLADLMQGFKVAFVPPETSENLPRGQLALARISHDQDAQRACIELAQSVLAQWPYPELDPDRLVEVDASLLDTETARAFLEPEWIRLAHNFEFSQYLREVQRVLLDADFDVLKEMLSATSLEWPRSGVTTRRYPDRLRGGELPTLQVLLGRDLEFSDTKAHGNPNGTYGIFVQRSGALSHTALVNQDTDSRHDGKNRESRNVPTNIPPHINQLKGLVDEMRDSPSVVQHCYGSELEDSIQALLRHRSKPTGATKPFSPTELLEKIAIRKGHLHDQLQVFQSALSSGLPHAKWLQHAGLWPNTSLLSLLSQLRSTSGIDFGKEVKQNLIKLGLAVTEYQRVRRIQDASLKRRLQQLEDESCNAGHANWDVHQRPDWLLLEIEGNILLRLEQVEVACATISPSSDENSVLQLLMGKGKTSCILRK